MSASKHCKERKGRTTDHECRDKTSMDFSCAKRPQAIYGDLIFFRILCKAILLDIFATVTRILRASHSLGEGVRRLKAQEKELDKAAGLHKAFPMRYTSHFPDECSRLLRVSPVFTEETGTTLTTEERCTRSSIV